jgi:hypothetical protein
VTGVSSPAINIANEVSATIDDLTGCTTSGGTTISGGPFLVFGNLQGPVGSCGIATGNPGIQFFPNGATSSAGNFLFAQLITADSTVDHGTSGTVTCTATPGLDGAYPYQNQINPASTSDSPEAPLPSSYATVTRNFDAIMYLLWQSTTAANSIPVPLGYIPWTFNATATNTGTVGAPVWTASGAGAPVMSDLKASFEGIIRIGDVSRDAGTSNPAFVLAVPTQPNLGFPTWTGLAIPSAKCGTTE